MWHLETRFSGGFSSAGEQLNSMTLEGFSNPNNSIFLYLVPSKRPCSHPMQKKPPGSSLQSQGCGETAPGSSPVLLGQQELLEVQVQLLARGCPDGPHAVHAARLVPAVAGGQHAADGGIVDCPSAGGCNTEHGPAGMGTGMVASVLPSARLSSESPVHKPLAWLCFALPVRISPHKCVFILTNTHKILISFPFAA